MQYQFIFFNLVLSANLTAASIPRSSPTSRYSRFLEELEESVANNENKSNDDGDDGESSSRRMLPWNSSPNIDSNGFLLGTYGFRFGDWERDANLQGRHGYRRIVKKNLKKIRRKEGYNQSSTNASDGDSLDEDAPIDLEIGRFQIRQVPGDGNCLFHSLALCLHYAEEKSQFPLIATESFRELFRRSRRLRSLAVEWLQNNEDGIDRLLFLQGDEYLSCSELLEAASSQYKISTDEYCKLMQENCTWGGGPEIVALSNALRRPIHVYELSVRGNSEGKHSKQFQLCRMACFGSPKYDRNDPLHILSADSRFPDIAPGRQLNSGNHFLALFPVKSLHSSRRMCKRKPSFVRGGKTSFDGTTQKHDSTRPSSVQIPIILRSLGEAMELWFCRLRDLWI